MIGIERFVAYRMTLFDNRSFTAYILKFAIAAIALSVAVMIIATSVIQGFKNEISQKMFDFWGHIVITDARASQAYDLLPIDNVVAIIDDLKKIDRIVDFQKPSLNDDGFELASTKRGIKDVYPFSVIPSIISTKSDEFEGLLLKGVEAPYTIDILKPYVIEGSVMNFEDENASRDMLISEQSAHRMKLSVGDAFIVHFIFGDSSSKKRFRVSGIYRSGLEEYDQRFAFIDHRWVEDLLGWGNDQYAGMEVHIEDISEMETIQEYIYLEKLPSYLLSETIKSRSSEIFEWLELQNINERLTLILMTVVGIFNMITAFLIFTLERTRMIGLLKSLGATNWVIRKIFLISSGFILLRGTVIGVLLGLLFCVVQKNTGFIKLSEKDYYLSQVPIEINGYVIALIAMGSLLITLIFLILPSSIVSRISPVSALQFK